MGTTADKLYKLAETKNGIKQAIIGKGIAVADDEPFAAYPVKISAISGGSTAAPSDINFYDYDGTLVSSWSLDELAAATALPANPTHDGLTAQGWNWTLADLKAANRPMNVGQMYITDDGKTRLYITIAAPGRMSVPLYIQQSVANGVTINWGDGSAAETLPGTGRVNTTHTYADIGSYVITLAPSDGCTLALGTGTTSYCVLGNVGVNGRVYCNMLQKAEIGSGVTSIGQNAFESCPSLSGITIPGSVTSIGNSAFNGCYSLSNITIPEGVTSIGNYAFYYCYGLLSITIPDSVTGIGESVFQYCPSLSGITIPGSVTSIGNSSFGYCYSLSSITIPDSVTSIGVGAFNGCYGMAEYHLKPTTPPTLANTNAFDSIPSDCIIYVPAGSLSAYQTATNWATYADYMQEETV